MIANNNLADLILRIVRETAEAKGLDASRVTTDAPVDSRLGLDSLDWATVVVRLEMETGLDPFAGGAATELKTVNDLIGLYIQAAGH